MHQRRFAFSMISVLVLLGILAFGMALASTFVGQIRRSAARAESANNLRQIGIGAHAFHDTQKALPPMIGVVGETHGTAHFHMLPYVEQDVLYRRGQEDMNKVRDKIVPVFVDRQDPSVKPDFVYRDWLATTNYAGNFLVFKDGAMRLPAITDGTSNTILFAQRYQLCGGEPTAWSFDRPHRWAPMFAFFSRARFQEAPDQSQCDPALPQALTKDGMLVAMGDASVRAVLNRCSPLTWSAFTTPDGGEVLGDDFER